MKRILVVLLVLLLVSSVTLAENAGIDLSGKTVDELIAIRQAVDEALFEQGGKVILPQGMMVVGKDIAAGSYEIRSYQNFNVVVWKSEEAISEAQIAYSKNPNVDTTQYMSYMGDFIAGDIARITLNEGQVLMCNTDIEGGTMTIEKVSGLFMD